MNQESRRRYEMLGRVHAFGSSHAEEFPLGTLGHDVFADVRTCLRAVERHATVRLSRRGQGRASKAAARRVLWRSLRAIRRTARALALDAPGFDERFRLPRGNGDRRLLAAARGFALDARASAAAFIAHGLPTAFLDDLALCIDEFERSMRAHREGRAARISASAGLKASLQAGFLAVRRLDAVIPNVLHDKPGALSAWQRARRVERRARSHRIVAAATGEAVGLTVESPICENPCQINASAAVTDASLTDN
jgi:hypothetical protein